MGKFYGLKIGQSQFGITLAARQPKPAVEEMGATGTQFFGGYLVEEDYNPDWRGEGRIMIPEKMRKSDGQVKAALLACELPLRAAQWEVIPASDKAVDVDAAELVSKNLFEGMSITWDDVLRHVFLMYAFGFSTFEKVWIIEKGQIKWRKLAPRLPKSIQRFKLDDEGGLLGVEQMATKKGMMQRIDIPAEKLLVFTLDKEGSDFKGTSLLRAAYKHWYIKDQLYKIDGIAAERHGAGLPVFEYPLYANDAQKKALDEMGKRIQAHQKGYLALPVDFKFKLQGVEGQLHPVIQSVDHHNLQITKSILAQFIDLAGKEVGSYALSHDQSSFFLMALRTMGKLVCSTINRYGIPQLVDYNFTVESYPKLNVSGLEVRELGVWSKAVADLTSAGALLPDQDIEDEVRRVLRLPPREAPEIKRASQNQDFATRFVWRLAQALADPDTVSKGQWKQTHAKLDASVADIISKSKAVQEKQIDNLVDQAVKLLEAGHPEKLEGVAVKYTGELATHLARALQGLYDEGGKDVRKELGK